MKKLVCTIAAVLALVSCSKDNEPDFLEFEDENGAKISLQKTDFSDLRGWKKDNLEDMVPAFEASCGVILKTSSPELPSAVVKINTSDYQRACMRFFDEKIGNAKDFKKFLQDNFVPYLVSQNGVTDGKFTSYYQAKISASTTPDDKYKYPIYGKPADLIEVNLADFGEELPKTRLLGRVQNQKMVPYYTRAEIENNPDVAKDFPILLWGDNPVDILIMQIQGSAIAELPDGETVSLAYADNNGRKFSGIGSVLLAAGKLEKGKASMGEIKKWLEANLDEAKKYMQQNERYVFQRISNTHGAVGAQGVELTAQRSIAVDKTKVPLGAMFWLETTGPDGEPLEKTVIAQDIGGAIKGAVRGDYFWGYGDNALEAAGKMNAKGRYYIFMPKEND